VASAEYGTLLTTLRTLSPNLSYTLKTRLLQLPFLNLPQSQLNRLPLILNSFARAVSKSPKCSLLNGRVALHRKCIRWRSSMKIASCCCCRVILKVRLHRSYRELRDCVTPKPGNAWIKYGEPTAIVCCSRWPIFSGRRQRPPTSQRDY